MTAWTFVVGLATITVTMKAVGPLVIGDRVPGPMFLRVMSLTSPALLSALALTALLADGRHFSLGADAVGTAVGAVLVWRGRSLVAAVATAVAVTAALRLVL